MFLKYVLIQLNDPQTERVNDSSVVKVHIFCLSVTHSLTYFYTSAYGVSNFPEFVTVGLFDGAEISYYDSNTSSVELRQDWMKKVSADDPHYLENEDRKASRSQRLLQTERDNLMLRFNQTGGEWTFPLLH